MPAEWVLRLLWMGYRQKQIQSSKWYAEETLNTYSNFLPPWLLILVWTKNSNLGTCWLHLYSLFFVINFLFTFIILEIALCAAISNTRSLQMTLADDYVKRLNRSMDKTRNHSAIQTSAAVNTNQVKQFFLSHLRCLCIVTLSFQILFIHIWLGMLVLERVSLWPLVLFADASFLPFGFCLLILTFSFYIISQECTNNSGLAAVNHNYRCKLSFHLAVCATIWDLQA